MQTCVLGEEETPGAPLGWAVWGQLCGKVQQKWRLIASWALSRSKARKLRKVIISSSRLARSCLDIHEVCTSNTVMTSLTWISVKGQPLGVGLEPWRERWGKGTCSARGGHGGWIWSPSSSLLEALSPLWGSSSSAAGRLCSLLSWRFSGAW